MMIEVRLGRLERENRQSRASGVIALMGTASVLLTGQFRPNSTIDAESFVVRDRNGVQVARLGAAYSQGSLVSGAALMFYGPDGTLTAWLWYVDDEPMLQMKSVV